MLTRAVAVPVRRSVLGKQLPDRKTSEIWVIIRVERGDRAVVILPGKQWFSFVREGLERFAIACTGMWRELFTRARFLIRRNYKQGD